MIAVLPREFKSQRGTIRKNICLLGLQKAFEVTLNLNYYIESRDVRGDYCKFTMVATLSFKFSLSQSQSWNLFNNVDYENDLENQHTLGRPLRGGGGTLKAFFEARTKKSKQ